MKKIHSKKALLLLQEVRELQDVWLILEDGSFVIFIMIPGALLSVSFSCSVNIKNAHP